MRTIKLRGLWSVVAIGLLIAAFQFPAAVADEDLDTYGLAEDVVVKGKARKTERLALDASAKGLDKYKGIVLTDAALERLSESDQGARALRTFFQANRLVAVVDGDLAEKFGLPRAGDQVFAGVGGKAQQHPGHAAAILADGSLATYTHAYATRAIRGEKFADDALAWFESHRLAERTTTGTAKAHAAHWTLKQTASYCYELDPYGKICYVADFYQNNADGSSTYDWWNVKFETQTTPGYDLYWSEWRTSTTWMTSDVNYYNPGSHLLVDWGPANAYTGGGTTVSVSVGPRNGVHGAVLTDLQTHSYYIEAMGVAQASNTQYSDAYVRHDFDYGGGPTTYQFSSYPSYTVRTSQGQCLYVPYTNKAEWREYTWNGQDNFYNTWINSWRQVCP